jgi:O-antigen/teichoic acid export membrane protein
MQPEKDQYRSHSLAGAIGRSTIMGMVANVAQMLTRLVTVPIVIHHLGLGGYGIWNVIMLTATYMRFGSVGVKTAFQKYVAEATGNGDFDRANKLLTTGSAVMLVVSLAGLIPVMFLSQRLAHMSGVPPEFLKSAAVSISLLAMIMLMSNVGAVFEAVVMGGHRVDLLREICTVLSIVEAVSTVAVLHCGYGLAAMAAVMGSSELVYLACCYFASHRIVPEIRLGLRFLSKDMLYEFFRFAGSYQLVNVLDVFYNSLIPIAILRSFGADSAGIYAIVTKIVGAVGTVQSSFLVPMLSAGTMVFASGSVERIEALLSKAFKVTLGLSLFPLGFAAAFGPTIAYAWTGQSDPAFGSTFWLVSTRSLFAAFSLLALVLYRATGKVLLDNIRQALRILVILGVLGLASQLGFVGVMTGLAACELAGMLFLLFALSKTFDDFHARTVVPGMVRLSIASTLMIGAGVVTSYLLLSGYQNNRLFAVMKLMVAGVASIIVAWPLLVRTGSITSAEKHALLISLSPRLSRTNA